MLSVCLWRSNERALFHPLSGKRLISFCSDLCHYVLKLQVCNLHLQTLSMPVDHKPIKIWKGGIIARGPMWFLAERGLFSLGDVMGICKICSAVIHCFDSFHWPFLVPVILCVGRSCGLFLAFSYSSGSFLALAWCPVEMLCSSHQLWVPVLATKAELCSTQTPLVPVPSSQVGLKADNSL